MSKVGLASPELLRELPLFADLDAPGLAAIASIAEVREVDADAPLLAQGQPATNLYVVLRGRFSLCLERPGGQEQCMLTMTRGEIIGWSGLLDQPTWMASATALKPSSVLVIDGEGLRGLCEADHELGYRMMRKLFAAAADRLQDTRLQLLDMYGHG